MTFLFWQKQSSSHIGRFLKGYKALIFVLSFGVGGIADSFMFFQEQKQYNYFLLQVMSFGRA